MANKVKKTNNISQWAKKITTEYPIVLPLGRANTPEKKNDLLTAISIAWSKHPYLKLGDLLDQASRNWIDTIEDEDLKNALLNFDLVKKNECGAPSPSRTIHCTLVVNHHENKHLNHKTGIGWKKK